MKKLYYLLLSLIMLYFTVTYLQAQIKDSIYLKQHESVKIAKQIDDMPVSKEANKELLNFLKQKVNYIQDTLTESIEDKELGLFTLTKEDNSNDINLIKSLFPLCDAKLVSVPSIKVGEQIDDMPVFTRGWEELMFFLRQNVNYPQDAIKQGIEGRVVVHFTISKDGSAKDINIVRSLFPSCDAEAVRVVSIMPKWVPGKLKGKPVDAIYTLPLSFKLPKPSSVTD